MGVWGLGFRAYPSKGWLWGIYSGIQGLRFGVCWVPYYPHFYLTPSRFPKGCGFPARALTKEPKLKLLTLRTEPTQNHNRPSRTNQTLPNLKPLAPNPQTRLWDWVSTCGLVADSLTSAGVLRVWDETTMNQDQSPFDVACSSPCGSPSLKEYPYVTLHGTIDPYVTPTSPYSAGNKVWGSEFATQPSASRFKAMLLLHGLGLSIQGQWLNQLRSLTLNPKPNLLK